MSVDPSPWLQRLAAWRALAQLCARDPGLARLVSEYQALSRRIRWVERRRAPRGGEVLSQLKLQRTLFRESVARRLRRSGEAGGNGRPD